VGGGVFMVGGCYEEVEDGVIGTKATCHSIKLKMFPVAEGPHFLFIQLLFTINHRLLFIVIASESYALFLYLF
jgi:hypothetical protein